MAQNTAIAENIAQLNKLKLISSLTIVRKEPKSGKEIANLISKINEMGQQNKQVNIQPQGEPPPIAA